MDPAQVSVAPAKEASLNDTAKHKVELDSTLNKARYYDLLMDIFVTAIVNNSKFKNIFEVMHRQMQEQAAAESVIATWIKVIVKTMQSSKLPGLSEADINKIAEEMIRQEATNKAPSASNNGQV